MNLTSSSFGGTHGVVVRHGYNFTIKLYTVHLNTSLKIASPDLKRQLIHAIRYWQISKLVEALNFTN
jgi:hypothetical protein